MNSKIIIILILILNSFYSFSQKDKVIIENTFNTYLLHVAKLDNDSIITYLYPKIFDEIPKDVMLKSMNDSKKDSFADLKFENLLVWNISKTETFKNIKFANISYAFDLNMKLRKPEIDPKDPNYNPMEFTNYMLVEQYGKENVKMDLKEHSFQIHVKKECLAILDPKYIGWKFIENNPQMQSILSKVLPLEILNKKKQIK